MRDEVVARLEAIFAERLHMPAPSTDAELLESGLLDSLQFVDLLLVIELVSIPHDAAAVSRPATRH